jgi:hypothetical protein
MRYSYAITIEAYPCVLRRCARCGEKKPFLPSDQIRINAQKKLLDVWLIHKCRDCGQTWNMEVFSRVSPGQLDRTTYNRMLSNDPDLIRSLAFDPQLHARAGAPLCQDTLTYKIDGERLCLDALTEPAELSFICPVPLGVRLSRLLREILGLSARQIEALAASGRLTSPDAPDILKARMGVRGTVRVEPE